MWKINLHLNGVIANAFQVLTSTSTVPFGRSTPLFEEVVFVPWQLAFLQVAVVYLCCQVSCEKVKDYLLPFFLPLCLLVPILDLVC